MHIADISMFFAPHSGGVKRYLLTKHAWLLRRGIRHSVIVPGPVDRGAPGDIITVSSPRVPFGNGYRVPIHLGKWRALVDSLRPDILEAGDPYHLAWAAARARASARVAFAHSDLPRLLGSRFGAMAERGASRYLRALYHRFDLVFAPSALMAQRLVDAGIDRVVLQPLGVDTGIFHPRRADSRLRAQLGLAPDTRLLVFAGRLAPEKNVPVLISAFARLGPRYHLLLVGGESLQRLHENVTLYPYQAGGLALARLLASADALVHAGDQETFGLVVLEAMACGRPVIAVRAGALAELIDERVGMLVRPHDAVAMARGITDLYERDVSALGRQARARVETQFGWDAVFQRQLGHYERLLQAASREDVGARALS